jgi:hypothetical protein
MMSKHLIALAIAAAMSVPATAQPAQTPPPAVATNPAQAQPAQSAQPQMVKKTVCEDNDNPYSNIHRLCHTVMVPAQPVQNRQPQAAQQPQMGK